MSSITTSAMRFPARILPGIRQIGSGNLGDGLVQVAAAGPVPLEEAVAQDLVRGVDENPKTKEVHPMSRQTVASQNR